MKAAPETMHLETAAKTGNADHYTRTVSEWTEDSTILVGLRDVTIGAVVTV